jgi:hypothetical protein
MLPGDITDEPDMAATAVVGHQPGEIEATRQLLPGNQVG